MKLPKVIASMTVLAATMTIGQMVNIKVDTTTQASLPTVTLGIQKASASYMDNYFQDGNIVSLVNNGQYLNLHFLTKGGMIQSSNADGTDDQKFRVIRKPGTNQVQFERVNSDRMIITPSVYKHLGTLEAWQRSLTVQFHPMQTWYVDVANTPGTFWLKPVGSPNFALNLPFGRNNVKSTLANFDSNDNDLKWSVQVHHRAQGTTQPQVVQPTYVQPSVVQPQNVVQPVVQKPIQNNIPQPIRCKAKNSFAFDFPVESKYEAVIGALGNNKNINGVGHSFFGIVETKSYKLHNGNCGVDSKSDRFYKTVSAEGTFKSIPTIITGTRDSNFVNSVINNVTNSGYSGWEMNELRSYYDKGMPKWNGDWVFLRKEISADVFNTINSKSQADLKTLTGCQKYWALPTTNRNNCHCGDVTARMWGETTGDWRFNNDAKPSAIRKIIN